MWNLNYLTDNKEVKKEQKNQYPPIGSVRKINNQWYKIIGLYFSNNSVEIKLKQL